MKWSVLILWASLLVCPFSLRNSGRAIDDLDHIGFEGVVTDGRGHVLAGARVIARQTDGSLERAVTTDEQGRYRLTTLAPGRYLLLIEANGFQSLRLEGVGAAAGATVKRDFRLDPATIESAVTIDAGNDRSLIDTSRTVVGGTITKAQIDLLPVESRQPLDLIFTLPGTSAPALSDRELAEGDRRDDFRKPPEEAGIFSLNGGAPFSNNLTIEGLDNNDDRAARERFIPSLHSVEEVQVIANQFSAEYGRASGGRVNLRLRGGANRFHGQIFDYFRDESLNANSFTRNADPERGKRLPFQNHNPGAGIGGPVIRERALFYGAYEYDEVYDRTEITALVPVETNPAFPLPAPNGANLGSAGFDKAGKPVTVNGGAAVGLFDQQVTTPRRSHTFQSRVDLHPGPRHSGFALLTAVRQRDERGFPGGRRTLDTLRRTGRDSRSIAFAENFVISERAVNTARFQFSRLTPVDAPAGGRPVVIIEIDDPRDVIGGSSSNPLSRRGSLVAGSSTLGGVDRREDRYQIQETLNYLRGSHTLRAGADLQVIRSRFIDLSDSTGTFTFASPADFLTNRPARYQHRFRTESELGNRYTGVFIQDDWRPRPNLTLAFGLRWDNETAIEDRDNFGPRLSFAWDPFASAKTVVRAGYGLFYNRALLRTLDDYVLTSNTIRVDTDNSVAASLLGSLPFPRTLAPDDPLLSRMGVREAGFLRRLGRGFRIPESSQASLGFERQIRPGLKIEVNYVFNRGLHLWRESNVNAPLLPSGFPDFTEYLVSRGFDNRRDPITGLRPITSTGNADVVRFNLSRQPSQTMSEDGRTVIVFGLNNQSTSNATSGLKAALAVLRGLRPDPGLTQIEELQSRGNSFYHGVSFEAQRRLGSRGFLRGSYTLSKLIDDGVVNTSSPIVAGDFRRERALSLLDARHRLAVSGSYQFPARLLRLSLSGTLNFGSSRPFNIGANGNDRNLDDVDNDRPNFSGSLQAIRWRRRGSAPDRALVDSFSLPAIGSSGDLPRNAGRGPGVYTLNLRIARAFEFGESRKVRLQIEAFNPFNSTVFSFGAEYVNFSPSALGDFLTPQRTVKPRTLRVGLSMDF